MLQPDGSYVHILPPEDTKPFDSQAWFINHPLFEIEEEDGTTETTISAIPSSA